MMMLFALSMCIDESRNFPISTESKRAVLICFFIRSSFCNLNAHEPERGGPPVVGTAIRGTGSRLQSMQYPPTMATRPSQRRLLSTPKTVLPRNIRLRFSAGFFCLGTLNNIVSATSSVGVNACRVPPLRRLVKVGRS